MKLTSRVDVNIGYSCNERCKFCYYLQTIKDEEDRKYRIKDLTTEECRRLISFIRGRGIETLEFTGGEPTIRGDLVELVEFARGLGFASISLITNGLRLAIPSYASTLVNAGVDDFLVSIHGHEAAVHDAVTEVPGSFDRAVQAVRNLKTHPVKVRANCVVSGFNYQGAVETLGLYHSLGIQTANFILFNPIEEADWKSAPELNVPYAEAAEYMKRAIDVYKERIRKITVRYIPFCLMRGYEQYVTNMPQIQYDPDEWDYLVRTEVRKGKALKTAGLVLGMLMHPSKRRAIGAGWNVFKHEGMKYFLQVKNKVYGPQCARCAYQPICDGLWKKYAEWRGFDELEPVRGRRVTDPTHFMRRNPQFIHFREEIAGGALCASQAP